MKELLKRYTYNARVSIVREICESAISMKLEQGHVKHMKTQEDIWRDEWQWTRLQVSLYTLHEAFFYEKDKTSVGFKWSPTSTAVCNSRGVTSALPAFRVEVDVHFEVPMSYRSGETNAGMLFHICVVRVKKFLRNRTVLKFHISRW